MKRIWVLEALFVIFLTAACGKEQQAGENGNDDSNPKEWTISGTVKGDDGKVLKDVVVSDGLICTKTTVEGRYYLNSDLSNSAYVFVSTPAEYAAPVKEGHACFWVFLKDAAKERSA